jgi:alpha-mannosidase
MHDEACPTYEDMLMNMMVGHDFIMKEFGVKPRIGWQLDPFGHSSTSTRLFAEMGFDMWVFGRGDDNEKDQRKKDQSMEFVWRPSFDSLGEEASILSHWHYNHYSPPTGFNFDTLNSRHYYFESNKLSSKYNAP